MSDAQSAGARLAAAAAAMVGAPFRLHGRDPATGVDCIGLLERALADCGCVAVLPSGYRLRMRDGAPVRELAQGWGLELGMEMVAEPTLPGDVALIAVGPEQVHVAIRASHEDSRGCARFIHAHAGLRRVVVGPAHPDWRTIGAWRLGNHMGQD
jgi:cell wall-associated NlpC family hydrolase